MFKAKFIVRHFLKFENHEFPGFKKPVWKPSKTIPGETALRLLRELIF